MRTAGRTAGRQGGLRPRIERLESRKLLSLVAFWVGQGGADLVGRDGTSPDGYQDIQIHLDGLDPARAVSRVDVMRYGGGVWSWSGRNSDNAALDRPRDPNSGLWSGSADVDFEAYFDDPAGARYELIRVTYADGSTADAPEVRASTPVDASLRVAGQELRVAWFGQAGPDLTTAGVAVGPDGFKDVQLLLTNLLHYRRGSDGSVVGFNPDNDPVVVSMTTDSGAKFTWLAGARPPWLEHFDALAQVVADPSDPTRATVSLSPVAGLVAGGAVEVSVAYNSVGKSDVSPKPTDPSAPAAAVVPAGLDPALPADPPPAPAYPVRFNGPSAVWSGQEATGMVRVVVSGLPKGWVFADAALTDNAGHLWTPTDPEPSNTLWINSTPDPTRAELRFVPARDETGSLMTLRLRLEGATTQTVTQFSGGAADVARLDPRVIDPVWTSCVCTLLMHPGAVLHGASVVVGPADVTRPGMGLQDLVDQYRRVHLRAGVYKLDRPLVLTDSVTLDADPGATLLFSQPADSAPWSYALAVGASHTTLSGFAVRFATPVRWANDFQMGPAVVGSTYGENHSVPPKVDMRINGLDLRYDASAADVGGGNLTSVRLVRMNRNDSGEISRNTLRGGAVEVFNGPWRFDANDFQGVAPGSALTHAFAVHDGHDVSLTANHVHNVGASGTTYGLVVFSGSGTNLQVLGNVVDGGVGRDASAGPAGSANYPEMILTESYYPHFEGAVTIDAASPRLLRLPVLQGDAPRSGDLVSILAGPSAGRLVRVAQAVDAHTLVLDGDLPAGRLEVSVTRGFVHETYAGNAIDLSGLAAPSSVAFQLVGAHADVQVSGNVVTGAVPFRIESYPTQGSPGGSTSTPVLWGWSHLPVLDVSVNGNTFVDPVFWTADGSGGVARQVGTATFGVSHGPGAWPDSGRRYLTGSVTNNTFRSTEEQLDGASTGDLVAVSLGEAGALDPAEMSIESITGNAAVLPDDVTGRTVVFAFATGLLGGRAAPATSVLPWRSGRAVNVASSRACYVSSRPGLVRVAAPEKSGNRGGMDLSTAGQGWSNPRTLSLI
ncbi:MAG: hypothetical protein U0835_26175 [Isosphaeraceae bacterium]